MQKISTGLLVIVGLIHIAPIAGVLGAQQLSSLYGLSFEEPNLLILMRHRAVLFGLLGAFILYAARKPTWQPLAFLAASVNVISFIAIAWSVGGYNEAIRNVVYVDLVAGICLVGAMVLYAMNHRKS